MTWRLSLPPRPKPLGPQYITVEHVLRVFSVVVIPPSVTGRGLSPKQEVVMMGQGWVYPSTSVIQGNLPVVDRISLWG